MSEQLLPQQTVPGIINLLQTYSLAVEDITRACNHDPEMVHDALSIFAFDSCPLFVIASVRNTLHRLLVERGWKGDARKIWSEHDIHFLFTRR